MKNKFKVLKLDGTIHELELFEIFTSTGTAANAAYVVGIDKYGKSKQTFAKGEEMYRDIYCRNHDLYDRETPNWETLSANHSGYYFADFNDFKDLKLSRYDKNGIVYNYDQSRNIYVEEIRLTDAAKRFLNLHSMKLTEKFARKCEITGVGMNEGYLVDNHICIAEESDLINFLYKDEYKDLTNQQILDKHYDDGDEEADNDVDHTYCWTSWWDDESDWQWQFVDGKLIPIND